MGLERREPQQGWDSYSSEGGMEERRENKTTRRKSKGEALEKKHSKGAMQSVQRTCTRLLISGLLLSREIRNNPSSQGQRNGHRNARASMPHYLVAA